MARTKKCVKDADTGKCRKGIKSGRPRCSGKKADCVEDLNGRCRKSRKPGRPPVKSVVKRRYKKPRRKTRSDAGKPRRKKCRKTRSDAGKPRTLKCRKPRSDRGKSRAKRTGELLSINDYEKYLKVASDTNLLQNLLDQTSEMVANDETLNNVEQPTPSAPPPDVVDEAVQLLVDPHNVDYMPKEEVSGMTDTSKYSDIFYNPEFENYGAWYRDSDGDEWNSERDLPQTMKEEVMIKKASDSKNKTGGFAEKDFIMTDEGKFSIPTYEPKFEEYGAWRYDSIGSEWVHERDLPDIVRQKL